MPDQGSHDHALRIFYVEDDRMFSDLVTITLEKLGHSVCGRADNIGDAVAGIEKTSPDLVLLDIELNGAFGGIAVGDYLVSKTDIPFIYLSGHDDSSVLEEAKKTVPDGFLLKPFTGEQLRVAIEMALRT
jgi:two-component system, response regulator PdtaR